MIPALVQWEITDRCNYHCQHCYHIDSKKCQVIESELPDDEMQEIADIICKNNLFFVTFTGGEPLLRKNLIINLSKQLYAKGIIISLNTNLVLLDELTLSELKVHRLLISCPASQSGLYKEITRNGNYKKFEDKLKMVIELGVSHTVNMVVSKINLNAIKSTAIRMAELGVKQFATTPTSLNAKSPRFDLLLNLDELRLVIENLIWAHEELGMAVDIMEAIPKCVIPTKAFELDLPFVYRSCHAGKRNGTISVQGNIRPCGHNPNIFGNILKEEMRLIWDRMAHWREQSGNQHINCLSCDMFNSCGGGCRVDAETLKGNPRDAHPYMTQIIKEPVISPSQIILNAYTIIQPNHSFQSRPEGNGWLVASGSSRNIIEVNNTLYKFLLATRKIPPVTLNALAEKFNTSFENKDFQRVITMLIRKKFFFISKNNKE